MTAPMIEASDFVLRPFRAADARPVARLIGDWDVIRMLSTAPYPYGIGDAEAFIAGAQHRPFCWVIASPAPGHLPMGCVEIGRGLGYWLGRPYWGRGIMTRAAGLAVADHFTRTGAAEIVSGHFHDNPASRRVLMKLGFIETGRSVTHALSRGGTLDRADLVLSRQDWERRAA
ncbi:MAG: GNAT family N-acetyltransferase [Pseudomonadota bacterium]